MSGQSYARKAVLVQAAIVLVVIAVCLVLFWINVSARQAELREQNFRRIGDMTDSIRDSFATLDTSVKYAGATVVVETNKPKSGKPEARRDESAIDTWQVLFTNLIAQIEPPPTIRRYPTNGGAYACTNLCVERNVNNYQLELTYALTPLGTNSPSFTIQTDLGQMLRPLLNKPEFDDVLIANTNGEVQFQFSQALERATNSRARGNLIVRKLELVDEGKTNASTDAAAAAGLFELKLGGDDFKVFSQPLVFSTGVGEGAQVKWLVCGLIRGTTFRARTWEVSPTTLVVFLFVATGFLLLWPLLNIVMSDGWEELRPRQVAAVLASSFCICAALTLLLLYSNTRLCSENALDDQVESLGWEVQRHLQDDMRQMERLLSALDRHLLDRAEKANSVDNALTWSEIRRVSRLYQLVTNLSEFPTFSDVAWLRADGMQVAKATPMQASSLISLDQREYYRSLRERRAWYWSEFHGDRKLTNDFDFYLESVFSKTRNENCAVFARHFSFSLTNQWPTNCVTSEDTNFFCPVFSAVTYQPTSLFGVVLPAGCGFCLFERNGRVCFHSDEQYNLRENFIVENGCNTRLLTAIESRTSDHFDSHYHNSTHHVFVRPLSGTSLMIAAFTNEGPISVLHRNMVLVAAIFLLLLIALPLLLVVVLVAVATALLRHEKRSFLACLWPQTRDRVWYAQRVVWASLTAVVCGGVLLLSETPGVLLVAGVIAPLLWVLMGLFGGRRHRFLEHRSARIFAPLLALLMTRLGRPAKICRRPKLFESWAAGLDSRLGRFLRHRSSPAGPKAVNRLAHLLFLAIGLVLLAVFPSIACYRFALWQETAASMKATEFRVARDFQQRRAQSWAKTRKNRGSDENRTYWIETNQRRLQSRLGNYLLPFNLWMHTNTTLVSTFGTNSDPLSEFYHSSFSSLEDTDLGTGGFILTKAADRSWFSGSAPNALHLWVAGGSQVSAQGGLGVFSVRSRIGGSNIFHLPPLEDGWRLLWYLGLIMVLLAPFLLAWFLGKHLLFSDLPHDKPTVTRDWVEAYENCNDRQKLILYQIARTGFSNASREELHELLKKKLIGFDPELKLAESFRNHVLEHTNPADLARAVGTLQEPSTSGWSSIRVILGLVITVIAIFLFMTQQQLWQLALGFASSFAAAAQDLGRVRSFFGKDKPEAEK